MNSIFRQHVMAIAVAALFVTPAQYASAQDINEEPAASPINNTAASDEIHIEFLNKLDDYGLAHPIDGATPKPNLSTDGDGNITGGEVAYFSHGAMIYRVTFDGQGKLISEGKTPDGRALDTMKQFRFGYNFGDARGVTAAMLGMGSDGNSHIERVSVNDSDGNWVGYMRFDPNGTLTSGVIYGDDAQVKSRWEGPPPAPEAPRAGSMAPTRPLSTNKRVVVDASKTPAKKESDAPQVSPSPANASVGSATAIIEAAPNIAVGPAPAQTGAATNEPPQASGTVIDPDGTQYVTAPDGTLVFTTPDGTRTVSLGWTAQADTASIPPGQGQPSGWHPSVDWLIFNDVGEKFKRMEIHGIETFNLYAFTIAQIGADVRAAELAGTGTASPGLVIPPVVVVPSLIGLSGLLNASTIANFSTFNITGNPFLAALSFVNVQGNTITASAGTLGDFGTGGIFLINLGTNTVYTSNNASQITTFDPNGTPGEPLSLRQWIQRSNNGFVDPAEGYKDNASVLTGTVPYNLVASTPPKDSLGRLGTLNAASLTANFTNSTLNANVDLTVAGQQWTMSGTNMSFFGGAKFNGQSFQALSGTTSNGFTVTKVGCATCVVSGKFNGGFVQQNFAGALLGYNVSEATSAGGPLANNITGNAVLQRSTVVVNASPRPTGRFYLLIDGTLVDASAVTTNAGGALTGFTMGGGATTSQVRFGGTATVTGTALGGAATLGTWDTTGGLSQVTQTTTTLLAPNAIVATYNTPLATASNLVSALTGQASYTLASSVGPTTAAGVAGTLNSASLAVDFSKQIFSTSLNATVAGATFAASANNAALGANGQFSFFSFIPATRNGTALSSATLQLNGALGGDTLAGAGYAYAFREQCCGGGTSFNGSVTFAGPAQSLNTTPFRDVLTSSHLNLFGGFLSVSGMANPAASATVNAQNQLTRYIAPFDPSSFAVAPTIVSAIAGTTSYSNTGMDAVTGLIWGRIAGGLATQDRAQAGAAGSAAFSGFTHYIAGAAANTPTTYPLSGVFNYALAGGTSPTDNQGNVGTLNSATLQANFTTLTVAASVSATVAGTTLTGSTADARITNSGFAASNGKAVGNLAVTCSGTCGTLNTGALQGVFTGAGAIGAAMASALNTAGTGGLNKTISVVSAFKR